MSAQGGIDTGWVSTSGEEGGQLEAAFGLPSPGSGVHRYGREGIPSGQAWIRLCQGKNPLLSRLVLIGCVHFHQGVGRTHWGTTV